VIEAKLDDSMSEVQRDIQAERLLVELHEIEKAMGRVRTFTDGPRVIDLDLLLFGEAAIDERKITLPHPRMHERRFVLAPLCEIAPDLVHPVLKKTCRELLAQIDDHYRVRLFEKAFLNPTSR
jgi:2-amino-4-hydroxy-6-hydroxymethyldihydropteridine diphosphokinase